jgi:hypothetical protein
MAAAAAGALRRRGKRRNDANSALAQISARRRRASDGRRRRLRISHGRLPAAAAIFLVLDAFLAVDALVAVEQRQLRAQLAEHAFAVVALVAVVIEQQLVERA